MIEHDPRCIDHTTCEGMIDSRDCVIRRQAKEIADLRAERNVCREAIRYWSYCTWNGLQKECPEKAPEFLDLCRSLNIVPYAAVGR